MLASLARAHGPLRTAPLPAPPSRARQRARAADASAPADRAAPATGDAGRRMAPAAGAPQPGLTVNVSNATGLRAAVANGSIGRIVLAAGNYSLTSATCRPTDPTWGFDLGPTGLCVGRAVTLAAAQAGTVMLDAGKKGRVLYVNGSGVALAGLNITGGKTVSARLSNFWSLPLCSPFRAPVDSLFSHAGGGGCSLQSRAYVSSRCFDHCLF